MDVDSEDLQSPEREEEDSEWTPEDGEVPAGPSCRSEKESDQEYLPSDWEDEDGEKLKPHAARRSKKKTASKRALDDGRVETFRKRIELWKAAKKTSKKSKDTSALEDLEPVRDIGNGLKIPTSIWDRLYRYQKTGIKWLWELNGIDSGGLLGDEMGLGKTVQIVGFLAGLAVSGKGKWNGLGPSVVIAPATVLHQWVAHFHEWWPPLRVAVLHASGSYEGCADRLIKEMHDAHGVIVTTYAGIIKHSVAFELRKWHYVVLDEGHKIRNSDTQVSKIVKKFETPHRIVVTGSPMQNNLQELWSLFDFMSPGLLGTLPSFLEHFAFPITQGGYANATPIQEATAFSLATALKNLITPYMLRRTKDDVKDHLFLPGKNEQVLFCNLTVEQKDLYKSFLLSPTVRSILDKESRFGDPLRAKILVALSTLKKICNHPDLFIYEVNDEDEPDLDSKFGHWKRAGKMVVINSLLKTWKKRGHRTLIFTQSRAMICILELFLKENNYKYLKMDGSTGIGARQPLIREFNSDDSYLVFLATTRVGGLGVNLTGADRVIIYDPDWNPATDGQAKERAWRIGQTRDVVIYRLLSVGSIEEKIYQRQVFKQLLTNKVLSDPNQRNFLKTGTLQGLFSLDEPDKKGNTETTTIFKHTEISLDREKRKAPSAEIFSKKKLDAMKRLAQQISKNIFSNEKKPDAQNDDENLETDVNFSTAMSENDAVTMFSKRLLESKEIEEGEIVDDVASPENETESETRKRKRLKKIKESVGDDIEYLENVKKYKSSRSNEEDSTNTNGDRYILEKLFSKSNIQSALQHDKVVGLAEREERSRIRAEAERRSAHALRMLRKSRSKDWK